MRHFSIDIHKYEIADKLILSGISLVINENERIAIVGPNGAGKTTFMRIVSGMITEYAGTVENAGNISVGYVEQIHFDEESRTVRDELRLAFAEILGVEREIREAEAAMEADSSNMSAIERYSDLLDRYNNLDGYSYEWRIVRVAQGLGVAGLLDQRISEVSGGQRTKIALAKVLLLAPDFLLLDEPTNFIDLAGVEWLEWYLADTWKGGYCIVSHDRTFLDNACTKTIEFLPEQPPTIYHTDYTGYVESRKKAHELAEKAYEIQQIHIESEKMLINRFRAGSRAGMAQSRSKALDKLDVMERPTARAEPRFRFEGLKESPQWILRFEDAFIGRKEPLFFIPELVMQRGDRVGIVGENGVGKSTFLKTILGQLPLLDGRMHRWADLTIGVYSQLHEELVRDETVYKNFERYGLPYTREKIAAVISGYGLSYEHVDRTVRSLSGGQTSKLLFAMLGCIPSNLLVLDEPTNHLDAESREALESALERYTGSVLFISHDRYFVNKVAKKIWVIESHELRVSYGNYDDYKQKKLYNLSYETVLINDEGEMDLLLEEKLGTAEAKRIKEKYARRRKK